MTTEEKLKIAVEALEFYAKCNDYGFNALSLMFDDASVAKQALHAIAPHEYDANGRIMVTPEISGQ